MEEEGGEVHAKPHAAEILAFLEGPLIGEKVSGKPLMSIPIIGDGTNEQRHDKDSFSAKCRG